MRRTKHKFVRGRRNIEEKKENVVFHFRKKRVPAMVTRTFFHDLSVLTTQGSPRKKKVDFSFLKKRTKHDECKTSLNKHIFDREFS